MYPNFFFYWKQFKFGMPWRKLVLKSNVNYHWISFIYFQAFSKWRGCNITLFVLLWFFVEVILIFIFSSILSFINFSLIGIKTFLAFKKFQVIQTILQSQVLSFVWRMALLTRTWTIPSSFERNSIAFSMMTQNATTSVTDSEVKMNDFPT